MVCEAAPPSLQEVKTYRGLLPWGEVRLRVWELPASQVKVLGATTVAPSTITESPAGTVATTNDPGAPKLAVTLRGALMATDCGLAAPLRSPDQPVNW